MIFWQPVSRATLIYNRLHGVGTFTNRQCLMLSLLVARWWCFGLLPQNFARWQGPTNYHSNFPWLPSVLALSLALAPHTSHLVKPSLPHYLIISKPNILCHKFHKSVKLLGYPCCCSSSHFSHNFDKKKGLKPSSSWNFRLELSENINDHFQ